MSPALICLLVAASGLASVTYQVIWERLLRLCFGADGLDATLITATFLLGLGLGAFIFGREFRRPLRVYAAVEAIVGLFAIVSFPLLTRLTLVLSHLFDAKLEHAGTLRLSASVGVVLFLLPPTILIGATLPLCFAAFLRGRPRQRVHMLYCASTVGAVAGALAPLALLARVSVPVALTMTASINFAVATALLRWSRTHERTPVAPAPRSLVLRRALVLAALSGAAVLAWELVVLRHVQVMHPGSPYNFALVLAIYLAALAGGSAWSRPTPNRFALAALAVPVGLLGACAFSRAVGLDAGSFGVASTGARGLLELATYLLLLLVPFGFAAGSIFPALLTATSGSISSATGSLYLASGVGSFSTAVLLYATGWDALTTRGVVFLVVIGLTIAGLRSLREIPLVVAAFVLLLVAPHTMWQGLAFGWVTDAAVWSGVEGRTGSALIVWENARRSGGSVWVDGKGFGALPDTPEFLWGVSHVLARSQRQRVLLLGLGSATALRELVEDAGVEHVDVVDWSTELPALLSTEPARSMTGWTLTSPKVRLLRTDARTAVTVADAARYDAVYESLTHYGPEGSTYYRSREYYRAVRRILRPGGVLIECGVTREDEAVMAAALESFGNVAWFPPRFLIAGDGELIDDTRLAAVLAPRAARLTGAFSVDQEHVRITASMLRGVRAVRDDELFGELTR
jgi:predicted membrane-bound spermidine synthase